MAVPSQPRRGAARGHGPTQALTLGRLALQGPERPRQSGIPRAHGAHLGDGRRGGLPHALRARPKRAARSQGQEHALAGPAPAVRPPAPPSPSEPFDAPATCRGLDLVGLDQIWPRGAAEGQSGPLLSSATQTPSSCSCRDEPRIGVVRGAGRQAARQARTSLPGAHGQASSVSNAARSSLDTSGPRSLSLVVTPVASSITVTLQRVSPATCTKS